VVRKATGAASVVHLLLLLLLLLVALIGKWQGWLAGWLADLMAGCSAACVPACCLCARLLLVCLLPACIWVMTGGLGRGGLTGCESGLAAAG